MKHLLRTPAHVECLKYPQLNLTLALPTMSRQHHQEITTTMRKGITTQIHLSAVVVEDHILLWTVLMEVTPRSLIDLDLNLRSPLTPVVAILLESSA